MLAELSRRAGGRFKVQDRWNGEKKCRRLPKLRSENQADERSWQASYKTDHKAGLRGSSDTDAIGKRRPRDPHLGMEAVARGYFACHVNFSLGGSPVVPALFEWQDLPTRDTKRFCLSLAYAPAASEGTGRGDSTPARLVFSREQVYDVWMPPGDPRAAPVLVLDLSDCSQLHVYFSGYLRPGREWHGVAQEVVAVWGMGSSWGERHQARPEQQEPVESGSGAGPPGGSSSFVPAGTPAALPPAASPLPSPLLVDLQPLSLGLRSAAAPPSQLAPPPVPIPRDWGFADAPAFPLPHHAASEQIAAVRDEAAIGHAIVLFISHARVSKDSRGGRSRKAYREHMTRTALAAMCAAAKAANVAAKQRPPAPTTAAPGTGGDPSPASGDAPRAASDPLLLPLSLELLPAAGPSRPPSDSSSAVPGLNSLPQQQQQFRGYSFPPPLPQHAAHVDYGSGGAGAPSHGDGGVGAEVARAIHAVTEERAQALGYSSRADFQVRR